MRVGIVFLFIFVSFSISLILLRFSTPTQRNPKEIAIGNKLAHYIGGDIEKITEESGLSFFFLIFTIVPIALGLLSFALHPLLKRLMHGVK